MLEKIRRQKEYYDYYEREPRVGPCNALTALRVGPRSGRATPLLFMIYYYYYLEECIWIMEVGAVRRIRIGDDEIDEEKRNYYLYYYIYWLLLIMMRCN